MKRVEEFYVNTTPHSTYRTVLNELREQDDPRAPAVEHIAEHAISFWAIGESSFDALRDIASDAAAKRQTPAVTLYNIPDRDNGGHSSKATESPESYIQWAQEIATILSSVPSIIIVEPDAVAHAANFNEYDKAQRFDLITNAMHVFKESQPGHALYLDAGHPNWLPADSAAALLKQAGIAQPDGFSLNVSNFVPTGENIAYGKKISKLLGGAHFIIDTSRNGNIDTAPNSTFNPTGRKLGQVPTTNTGHELVDAYLWVKTPGESDGNVNGGPPAGEYWPDYAFALA